MKKLIGTKISYKRSIRLGRIELSIMTLFKGDFTRTHDHTGNSRSILLWGDYCEHHHQDKKYEDKDIFVSSYKRHKWPMSYSFVPKGDFHSVIGMAPKSRIFNLTIHKGYC